MINKANIIEKVAVATGFPKKNVGIAIRAFENAVKDCIVDGEEVNLSGFIKLHVKEVAARERVIPATGKKMLCPAHKTVKVKVLKAFKDCVVE